MAVFYIYDQITVNTLQSFQHLLENEKNNLHPHIDIYIDEAESKVFRSWIFHNFIQTYTKLHGISFNTFLKRSDTGGLLVFLAVPYNRRYLSDYVSAEYSLQINTPEDELFEKHFINYLEKNKDFLRIGNYQDVIEVIVNNTTLNYTNVAHLSDKNLNADLLKKLGFAGKTFYPFSSGLEKRTFAERVIAADKPVYNIPAHIQEEIDKLKKEKAEGKISGGKLLMAVSILLEEKL